MPPSPYESEVTFLSGVDENGRIATPAYRAWSNPTDPAEYGLSTAVKWGDSRPGTTATINYLFDPASAWSSDAQMAFRAGVAIWSAVANVTITLVTDPAVANFAIVSEDDGAYFTFGDLTAQPIGGDRLLTPPAFAANIPRLAYDSGAYGVLGPNVGASSNLSYSTVVHELGHMLGLGHAGPYNGQVVSSQQFSPYDMMLWSTMSYINPAQQYQFYNSYPVQGTSWGFIGPQPYEPVTPMMLDILAVQRLYGAPTSGPLTGGSHTFGFNANIQGLVGQFYDFNINKAPIVTIWENSTNNTLDLSGFSQDAVISLAPGTFSSAGGRINNIGIAFGTVIETAIGGSGNDKIIASDVDSFLYGRAGTDFLLGGAGDDVLSGGAAPDVIDGGTGSDILRDILADMNGDTVEEFGLAATIDVVGSLIGRNHLAVLHDGDGDTTLRMGGTEILLEGGYAGGDFMAVARSSGGVLHTFVTFETFLPALFEGVRVDTDEINGVDNQHFMTGDGSVRFTITLKEAVSAFSNMLGYYRVAGDGSITGVDILFDNTRSAGVASVDLGTPGSGEKIAFFLIQNGFSQFGDLPDNLAFVTQGSLAAGNADAGQPLVLRSATLGLLDATIFHSIQALNPGDALQVLSGVAPGGRDLLIGFEDLPTATGDNDFQDVVINIHTSRDDVFIL